MYVYIDNVYTTNSLVFSVFPPTKSFLVASYISSVLVTPNDLIKPAKIYATDLKSIPFEPHRIVFNGLLSVTPNAALLCATSNRFLNEIKCCFTLSIPTKRDKDSSKLKGSSGDFISFFIYMYYERERKKYYIYVRKI